MRTNAAMRQLRIHKPGRSQLRSDADTGPYCCDVGRGAPLSHTPVWCDERTATELEAAATRAERTGVHGVVPDFVEEPCHRCLCGCIVSSDGQRATVGRPGWPRQREETTWAPVKCCCTSLLGGLLND
jgi:hypothetical protein